MTVFPAEVKTRNAEKKHTTLHKPLLLLVTKPIHSLLTPLQKPADARSALAGVVGELLLSATTPNSTFARRLSSHLQAFVAAALPPPPVDGGGRRGSEQGQGGGLLEGAVAGRGAGLLAASAVVHGKNRPQVTICICNSATRQSESARLNTRNQNYIDLAPQV